MIYEEKLQEILSHQRQGDTKKLFKNIRNGDYIILRKREEFVGRNVLCGINNTMLSSKIINSENPIIFNISNWYSNGYFHADSWSC